MKKIYLLFLILFTFTTTVVFSQTSHDKISYQSVVRDGNNHLLYDTTVTVVVTIKNSGDPAVKYRETHTVMSNANGLISFLIGDGDNQNGNWNAVQWNRAEITMETSVGGTALSTYTLPLSAVPYALYAKNAATSDYADSVDLDVVQHFIETSGYLTDELQVLSISNDTIYLSQGGWVKLPAGFSGDYNDLINKPDLKPVATSGDYNDLVNKPTKSDLCDSVKDCVTGWISDSTQMVFDTLHNYYATKKELRDTASALRDVINAEVTQLQNNIDTVSGNVRGALVDTAAAIRADMRDAAHDAKITIQKNGVTVGDFTLNQATPDTIDITVPTKVTDLEDADDYVTKAKLSDTLKAYTTTSQIDTLLGDYATIAYVKDTLKAYYDTTLTKKAIHDTANALRGEFPTVNNGKITIAMNRGTVDEATFYVNQDGEQTVMINLPDEALVNNGQLTIITDGDTTRFTANQSGNDTVNLSGFVTTARLNDTLKAYTTTDKIDTIVNKHHFLTSDSALIVRMRDSIQKVNAHVSADSLVLATRMDTLLKHVCDTVKPCVTGWINDTLKAYTTTNEIDTIVNKHHFLTSDSALIVRMRDSIQKVNAHVSADSLVLATRIHDDSLKLATRMDTLLKHVCDTVKPCVTGWMNDTLKAYTTTNKIDTIVNKYHFLTSDSALIVRMRDSIQKVNAHVSADSLVLATRMDTLLKHVCDTVKPCVTDWMNDTLKAYTTTDKIDTIVNKHHFLTSDSALIVRMRDSIQKVNAHVSADSLVLATRMDTLLKHVCDSVKPCVTDWMNDTLKAYTTTDEIDTIINKHHFLTSDSALIVRMRDSIQVNATAIQANATNIGINKQAIIDSSAHIRNDIKNGQITIAVNRSTTTTETTVTHPTFGVNQETDQTVTITIPQETTVNNGQLTIVAAGDTTRFTANQANNDTMRLNMFATKDTLKNFVNKLAIRDSVNNIVKDSLAAPNSAINLAIDTIARHNISDSTRMVFDTLHKYYATKDTLNNFVNKLAIRDSVNNIVKDSLAASNSAINMAIDTIARHNISDSTRMVFDTLHKYYATKDTLKNFVNKLTIRDSVNNIVKDSLAAPNSAINIAIDTIARHNISDSTRMVFDTLHKYYATKDTLKNFVNKLAIRDSVNNIVKDSLAAPNSAINIAIDTIARHNISDSTRMVFDTLHKYYATKDTLKNFVNKLAIRDSVNNIVKDSLAAPNSAINIAIDTIARHNISDSTRMVFDTLHLYYATKDTLKNFVNKLAIRDSVNNIVKDSLAAPNSAINIAIDTIARHNISDSTRMVFDTLHKYYATKDTLKNFVNKLAIRDSVNNIVKDSLAAPNSAINIAVDTIARHNISDSTRMVFDTLHLYYATKKVLKDTASAIRGDICDSATACITKALANANSEINHAVDTITRYNIHDTATAIRNSIGNGQITITRNDATITNGSFNLNQKTDQTINITVPTTVAELTDEANYAKVAANNQFTGTNTVPRGFVISGNNATNGDNCNNIVVNACDLWAVFDSLTNRIKKLEDNVGDLETQLAAVQNAVPPTYTTNGLVAADTTDCSVKVTATFASDVPITSYQFCYSKNADMSNSTCVSNATNVITLQGLTPYTHYYVTASATNLAGSTNASDTIDIRTKASKPDATVGLTSTTPAGFSVALTGINLGGAANGSVQVCYQEISGTDCPEEINNNCNTAVEIDSTQKSNSQNFTGLSSESLYCVKVIVSNEDSSYVHSGVVQTGKDITLTLTGPHEMNLCGGTKEATYLAALDGDDVSHFSISWNNSDSTGLKNVISFSSAAPDSLIKCTATRLSDNFSISAEIRIDVTNGTDHIPSFTTCENGNSVTVKSVSETISLDWGDGSSDSNPTAEGSNPTNHSYSPNKDTVYTITALGSDGCTATKRVAVGSMASIAPCKGIPHTDSEYEGDGLDPTINDGFEYGGTDSIVAVTDYEGNIYSVVQIGSQCWLAENMRCKFSPSQNVSIFNPQNKTGDNYTESSRWMAAEWYNNKESNSQYGLLYNWCAAVDTFYQEGSYNPTNKGNGAGGDNRTNGWPCVFNTASRRGVCPKGWHIPSADEWNELIGQITYASELVKGCKWSGSSNNTHRPNDYSDLSRNSSGFGALPGGFFEDGTGMDDNGSDFIKRRASFWSSSQYSDNNQAMSLYITHNNSNVSVNYQTNKFNGASVRCLRDQNDLIISSDPHHPSICPAGHPNGSSVTVTYSASVTEQGENATGYTFSWSTAEGSGSGPTFNVTYSATGTYTVTCTATKGAILLQKTFKTVVNDDIPLPSFTTCTNGLEVTLKDINNISSVNWSGSGNGNSNYYKYNFANTYTITATSGNGCTTSQDVTVSETGPQFAPCTGTIHQDDTYKHGYVYNADSTAWDGYEHGTTGAITHVTDYDGNVYHVVQIGSQCWMAENMRCTHSPKGYGNIVNPQGVAPNSTNVTLTRCWEVAHWWNNDSTNYYQNGLLYNWCAAADQYYSAEGYEPTGPGTSGCDGNYNAISPGADCTHCGSFRPSLPSQHRGICPKGWHLPTKSEFNTLKNSYSASDLKKACVWGNGDNSSGFSALPVGYFYDVTGEAPMTGQGSSTRFWSVTLSEDSSNDEKYHFNIGNSSVKLETDGGPQDGASVRCVRNAE